MDLLIHVRFTILELSKLHMYETYYEILQPYFGQENFQLHYIDTDGMKMSMRTENTSEDLKNSDDIFDFSNLDENYESFSKKKTKT